MQIGPNWNKIFIPAVDIEHDSVLSEHYNPNRIFSEFID
jgi:hypothetical protein